MPRLGPSSLLQGDPLVHSKEPGLLEWAAFPEEGSLFIEYRRYIYKLSTQNK